ncbi:hypothetical protein Fmac_004552 [Flemingia macrophylla]|uniref:DUF641 domain-containing protein n=1 Tax=Flemingia macrophylla TaxID=520843 RepID=A0ABD1N591_9FABA
MREDQMETTKRKSALKKGSKKVARTLEKVMKIRGGSNKGMCMLKVKKDKKEEEEEECSSKKRATMEALAARLLAGVTTIKAAYAELQMAQHPYDNHSIQAADQAVVDELRAISELKRRFIKRELHHLSPQVTIMLAQIQEQQSLIRTYQVTIKRLQHDLDARDANISSLNNHLNHCVSFNKTLHNKLNSSGALSSLVDSLSLSSLTATHFLRFLHHTLRSVRAFSKLLISEMESAHWDLDAAVMFIHPDTLFALPSHKTFAFESFLCITMFEGFTLRHHQHQDQNFDEFKKVKSMNPKQYLTHHPNSSFSVFLKSKYLQVVHAKMECSLFGNLNQRKVVNSGGYPDSAFFVAFAEMAKRVWALHCLAMSFGDGVTVFQVKKNTRFSEVYMESVTEDPLSDSNSGDLRVAFTVVPGFNIGKTVIQSQVYLSHVASPATS